MAIRFLSSETIDGALTVNSTVTLNKTNNVISIPSLVDNGKFLSVTQTGNETWDFKCESLSGSLDGVTIGTTAGKVAFDENGQIQSTQLLDLTTAGGRLTGFSNRGYLSSIHLEQTATNTDGGYIRFQTAPSGSTTGVERLRITDTGAFSIGSTGTNYGTSGQVLTSGGNSNPTWTTPTTGDVTGSGAANYVTYWTGTKAVSGSANFQYDGAINVALGSAPTAFGSGVPNILFKGTSSTNGRAGAIWFKENDGTDTAALYVTDGNDGYGTVLTAYQGDLKLSTGSLTGTKMTIQNAGDVLMGNTVVNPASGFSNQRGFGYDNSTGNLEVASTSGTAMQIGRNESTDGLILQLRKEGTVKHSIGSVESYFTGEVGINVTSPNTSLHVGSSGTNAYSATITKGSNMKGIMNTLSNNADDMVGIYFATGTTTEGTHWSGITGSRSNSASHWGTQLNFYTHADDVAALNDATQKMVILGDGEVGIGTTSPDRLLDVSGTGNVYAKVQSTDSTAAGIELDTAGGSTENWLIQADESIDGLAFYDLGRTSYRMVIDDLGQVGIGTTAPEQKLHVEGSSAIVRVKSTTNNQNASIWFNSNQGGTQADRWEIGTNISAGTDLEFFDRLNSVSRMVIQNDGKVGIGTISPSSKLFVKHDVASEWAGTFQNLSSNAYGLSIDCSTASSATFVLAAYSPSGTGMFLNGTGNLGIGTTNPSYRLSIEHSGASGGIRTVAGFSAGTGNMSGDGSQINLTNWGDNYGGFIRTVNTQSTPNYLQPKMEFGLNYNNYLPADMGVKMVIMGTGLVGINNTNPSYTLDVTGSIRATSSFVRVSTAPDIWYSNGNTDTYTQTVLYMNQTNSSNNDANGYFFERGRISNSSTAEIRRWVVGARGGQKQMVLDGPGTLTVAGDLVAYGSPSDITLKKNIKPLENSLDKIKSLQGVSFTWKNPSITNLKEDIGFIAQDVKEVLPKLVRENEDGKLSMRHQGVIPILVEAMKEQQKQIDRLEEQIKKMSSKN